MTTAPARPRTAAPRPQQRAPAREQAVQPCAMTTPSAPVAGCRLVLVGTEGFGKTTIGGYGPDAVMVMAPGEGGYLTLLGRGLVPQVPIVQPTSWAQTLDTLADLAKNPRGRRTIVLDALVGFESMCSQHVCEAEFGGDWGERGFAAYGRGLKIVYRTWPLLLSRLESCAAAGLNVLVLAHAAVKTFKSPDGPDYDRYEANVGPETWQRLKAWADFVGFGSFRPIVDEARPQANVAKAKGKAIGYTRVLRCAYSPTADAKNQYGLADEYELADDRVTCAESFWSLVLPTQPA